MLQYSSPSTVEQPQEEHVQKLLSDAISSSLEEGGMAQGAAFTPTFLGLLHDLVEAVSDPLVFTEPLKEKKDGPLQDNAKLFHVLLYCPAP